MAELTGRYDEPHRRYHDRRHLMAVLDRVDELAGPTDDADAVRLAAWFHDAVYDPARADNEAASAELARTLLPVHGVGPAQLAEVVRLVLLTATHDPAPDDRDGAVLSDADLAVLGAARADYRDYATRVREEYAVLDEATFAAGRARILHALLDRAHLFTTPAGRDRWEAAARANLSTELAVLAGRPVSPAGPEQLGAWGAEDRRR